MQAIKELAIVIGDDVWFMSSYPAYPNGVCTYGGLWLGCVDLKEAIALDKLPITVLKQIVALAKEETCLPQ